MSETRHTSSPVCPFCGARCQGVNTERSHFDALRCADCHQLFYLNKFVSVVVTYSTFRERPNGGSVAAKVPFHA
jgi:hypothetical protein